MCKHPRNKHTTFSLGCGKQRGAVLLAALLVLIIGSSFLLLSRLNAAARQSYRDEQTARALSEAKDALIGFALAYADTHLGQPPGYLPCPDFDGNGRAEPDNNKCGTAGESVIGRLPWFTLKLPPLRDGAGECLWYAVSGNYKDKPKKTLTSDTDGQFVLETTGNVVAGANPVNRVIAIIFSPGEIIGTKARTRRADKRTECGSTDPSDDANKSTNYLDSLGAVDNATGQKSGVVAGDPGSTPLPTDRPSVFVMAPQTRDASGAALFNDVISAITPADFAPVYRRMERWVADRVRKCLTAYATSPSNGNRYPWVSVLNPSSRPSYQDTANARFGRLPDAKLQRTRTSGGSMSDTWPLDPDYSLYTCFDDTVVGNQPDGSWWWWDKWKEMVFYAVSKEKGPALTPGRILTLSLNGTSVPADMVLLVAGRRLPLLGQTRESDADKGNIAKYLEGDNVPDPGPGRIPDGDEAFKAAPATDNFNDVACSTDVCQ